MLLYVCWTYLHVIFIAMSACLFIPCAALKPCRAGGTFTYSHKFHDHDAECGYNHDTCGSKSMVCCLHSM